MAQNPATIDRYELENVRPISERNAERILSDAEGEELVSCKPVPGAEKMPPNKINIAPARTVRVYELGDARTEEYVVVTCLLSGGDGPGGILIDRAIVFDGPIIDMLDHILRAFDDADWSRGIKTIEDIRVAPEDRFHEHEHIKKFLHAVRDVLEEEAPSRYAMDLWGEYMKNHSDGELDFSGVES